MEFFNTLAGLGTGFVVGEEHTTTALTECKTNNGKKGFYIVKLASKSGEIRSTKLIIE